MVKVLKEDELETANSDKSWNESEPTNLIMEVDSDEPNYIEAKWTRRQPKPTPIQRTRRIEGHEYNDNKGADMGMDSRQVD
mgnify:CR=1 FL=1